MSDKSFVCVECGSLYSSNKNLRRHVTKCHPNNLDKLAPKLTDSVQDQILCSECPATLENKTALSVHLQVEHNVKCDVESIVDIVVTQNCFVCVECGKSYSANKNLRRHVTEHHPNKLDELAPKLTDAVQVGTDKSFVCLECGSSYSTKKDLRRHVTKRHPNKLNELAPKLTDGVQVEILCSECPASFDNKAALSHHLQVEHSVKCDVESFSLPSMDAFAKWKLKMEQTTVSKFVKERGSLKVVQGTRHYYVCHRSGYFVSKGTDKRTLKSQGSSKINAICPAYIKVTELSSGVCSVEFMSTHVGHGKNLEHLTLSNAEKKEVAESVAHGVPFSRVLKNIRDSMSDGGPQRIHLLNRKDLHNIVKQFGLNYEVQNDVGVAKGKVTSKLSAIRDAHNRSDSIDVICDQEEKKYIIHSQSESDVYEVHDTEKLCNCKLTCTKCNTCIHRYTCSCLDSAILENMCNYIHEDLELPTVVISDDNEAGNIAKHMSMKNRGDVATKLQQLQERWTTALNSVTDMEGAKVLESLMASSEATLGALKLKSAKAPLIPQKEENNCKRKSEQQRILYSTKKAKSSRDKPATSVEKPNNVDLEIILSLLNTD